MLRARFPQALLSAAAWVALLAACSRAPAQDDPAEPGPKAEKPAEKQPAPESAGEQEPKKFRGRLPNYYRQVVDEEQRKTIYQIQEEYAAKIDAVRKQLEALMAERDAKVEAVLTPEQRKEVERLREEARAKRRAERDAGPGAKEAN
jgi:Spy/CpxP family protein refolding chaperone